MRLRQAIKIVQTFRKRRPKLRALNVVYRHRASRRVARKYGNDFEGVPEWLQRIILMTRRKRLEAGS